MSVTYFLGEVIFDSFVQDVMTIHKFPTADRSSKLLRINWPSPLTMKCFHLLEQRITADPVPQKTSLMSASLNRNKTTSKLQTKEMSFLSVHTSSPIDLGMTDIFRN